MANYYKENLKKDFAKLRNIPEIRAEQIINDLFNLIGDKLAEMEDGDSMKLSQFFNFHIKVRREKKGKNPVTGEDMVIPATKVIVTKPSQAMKDKIRRI